jgi:O-acetylhomoserine/O-acetylserine sulfhydrylase-like pyridoxal-dependent enzyme
MYNSKLTAQGVASSPSYQLGRKYLKRGYGGLLSFKTKAGAGLSAPVFNRFKLVSLGQRSVKSVKDSIQSMKLTEIYRIGGSRYVPKKRYY